MKTHTIPVKSSVFWSQWAARTDSLTVKERADNLFAILRRYAKADEVAPYYLDEKDCQTFNCLALANLVNRNLIQVSDESRELINNSIKMLNISLVTSKVGAR